MTSGGKELFKKELELELELRNLIEEIELGGISKENQDAAIEIINTYEKALEEIMKDKNISAILKEDAKEAIKILDKIKQTINNLCIFPNQNKCFFP
jgi:hypothetical protein